MKENEVKLTFYVNECGEFPMMGKTYEDLTFEKAVEVFKNLKDERCMIPEMGFTYLNPDSIYNDMPQALISGSPTGEIMKTFIEDIKEYKECELVQKAILDTIAAFPKAETI